MEIEEEKIKCPYCLSLDHFKTCMDESEFIIPKPKILQFDYFSTHNNRETSRCFNCDNWLFLTYHPKRNLWSFWDVENKSCYSFCCKKCLDKWINSAPIRLGDVFNNQEYLYPYKFKNEEKWYSDLRFDEIFKSLEKLSHKFFISVMKGRVMQSYLVKSFKL